MSPASAIAPSKCHRSRRYMAAMQGCIKGKKKKKKKNTANLLDISCKLTVKKLPLSFTIIILRNGCSRFMPADRYMCRSAMLRERGRDKKKKRRGDVKEGWNCVWANQQREAENSLSFSLDLSACVCVCVCVCVWVRVHVRDPVGLCMFRVCQNSATLPSSSHRSRFVSLQLQVTKWHCAFMAALHGASHKPWND